MSWDTSLNDEQIKAASHVGSHAHLLAGPGTGKTLCLTRRIRYLVTEKNVFPPSILALTFTRTAAKELKNKVELELEGPDKPHISTLHSFALKTILANSIFGSQLPQPIRIADGYEERHIIQEELKNILGVQKIKEIQDLFNRLSADWESLSADKPEWENWFPDPAFLGAWREHRKIYGYILRSELVYRLKLAIYEEGIQVAKKIRHLLIDEYQDLNACDLSVIQRIVSFGVELYAVGDDDQSIYGFRHANPEGIRRFSSDYSPSKPLQLQECMRCDRKILDLGLYVAKQDHKRIKKDINCCQNSAPGEVQILRFPNQAEEADGIAHICNILIKERDVKPHAILILLRSDRHQQFSEPLRKALSALDIPIATMANPLAPLEEEDGRRFLCLLRLLSNERDHLAWRTLLKIGSSSIGSKTFKNLYDLSLKNGEPFYDTLSKVNSDPSLIRRGGSKIQTEFASLYSILNDLSNDDLSDLSSFINKFASKQIKDENLRSEILKIFQNVLKERDVENLDQLLRAINIPLENKEQDKESESVNIMTMHQAKGLSADAVFIAAAEDEYIPGRSTTDEQIGDERRLLYVSLTRARHFLYITHCNQRTGEQTYSGRTKGTTMRNLTRFLSGGLVRSKEGMSYIFK